jgi:dienelactone hydrolase
MTTKDISYSAGAKKLTGYLADGSKGKKAPGIVICHQGGGLRDHEKDRARMLADLGYVAFAIDMYGAVATKMEEAGPLMNELSSNPALWQQRVQAGIDVLKAQPNVDASRLAAIGFCFGGGTMIQMARWAKEMKCLVAFHPGMQGLPEKDDRPVVTKIMICAGQKDPLIPPEARERFLKLMADANADCQFITYARAGHSFTDKTVAQFNMPNFEYHADTDRRSWAAMRDLFDETLGKVS